MRTHRILLPAAALAIAAPLVAGCSSSSTTATTSTTTTAGPTTTTTTTSAPAPASTTTTTGTHGTPGTTTAAAGAAGPAVASAGGVTLSVTSTPRTGAVGATRIFVTVVVTGTVVPSRLDFLVTDSPSADQGQPATDQPLAITGPGTYTMPVGFAPPTAGTWATTVDYLSNGTSQTISVSGLPPHVGQPAPFPQLVTVVTG